MQRLFQSDREQLQMAAEHRRAQSGKWIRIIAPLMAAKKLALNVVRRYLAVRVRTKRTMATTRYLSQRVVVVERTTFRLSVRNAICAKETEQSHPLRLIHDFPRSK